MGGFLSTTIDIPYTYPDGISINRRYSIVTFLLLFVVELVIFFLTAGYSISHQNVYTNKSHFFPWFFSQKTKNEIKNKEKGDNSKITAGFLVLWFFCTLVALFVIGGQNNYFLQKFSGNTVPDTVPVITTAV
jgi:hypothetical protein